MSDLIPGIPDTTPELRNYKRTTRAIFKRNMNPTANLINDITRSELLTSCDKFINTIVSDKVLQEIDKEFQELYDTFGTLNDSDVETAVNPLIERAVSNELR